MGPILLKHQGYRGDAVAQYNRVAWNKSSLILKNFFTKLSNIKTINKDNLKWKVFIKVIKMTSREAWVRRDLVV